MVKVPHAPLTCQERPVRHGLGDGEQIGGEHLQHQIDARRLGRIPPWTEP